jgi:hypothetical protein
MIELGNHRVELDNWLLLCGCLADCRVMGMPNAYFARLVLLRHFFSGNPGWASYSRDCGVTTTSWSSRPASATRTVRG